MHSKSQSSDGNNEQGVSGAQPDTTKPPPYNNTRQPQLDPATQSEEPVDASESGTGLSGQTLGHYVIGERLGGGAMAAVYRAHDEILDQPIALKILLPGADAVTRERFRREARVLATLIHSHIIPTYQVGQTNSEGYIYIAMELVTGQSLAELLTKESTLTARDACALLAPVARALDYAHNTGVIHRDVKPSNILLRRSSEEAAGSVWITVVDEPIVPLLSDFGIARALDSPELTSAGRTIGTPAFMSPEQCAGNDEIDGRADIYSLGAVLYRCVVGRTPFKGSTTQILHAHVYDPLLIPEPIMYRVPASVLQIVQRAMAKEPSERYQRAAEMAHDLEVALQTVSYDAVNRAQNEVDATLTLDSIPVTAPREASHVLVPAPDRTPQFGVALARPLPAQAPTPDRNRPVAVPSKRPPARTSTRNRAGIVALGGALVVLLALLSLTLLNSLLPVGQGDAPLPENAAVTMATGEPAAVIDPLPQSTTNASTRAPSVGGATTPNSTATALAEATDAVAAQPSVTASVQPTLSVDPEFAFNNAIALYQEQDWDATLDYLILARRADPGFEKDSVDEMLIDAYVALATAANSQGNYADAESYLENAVTVVSDSVIEVSQSQELVRLHQATVDMVDAEEGNNLSERRALQQAHAEYGEVFFARGAPCLAAEQVDAALAVLADARLADRHVALSDECAGEHLADELQTLPGTIVYSSESNGQKSIYTMPVEPEAGSVLLAENGAQPSMRPDNGFLAFHSTRSDMQGLVGFDLTANLNPNDRSIRYTQYIEDSRDSPPSWSPDGQRLAYASTNEGDDKSRVYWVWAVENGDVTVLGLGRDPAWHPFQDVIVYNGVDDSGNQPGLWLTSPDGTSRRRLTNNGNDIRPVWSKDGQYVIFMSSRDAGNWDLYRVDITAPEAGPLRLTERAAQDGVPSVSPDGDHIAFLSDQDGYWRLWFIPVDGGEPQPLGEITGLLPSWLEHGIQWVQ